MIAGSWIVFSLNNFTKIAVLEFILSEPIWEDRLAGIPMMWSYKS